MIVSKEIFLEKFKRYLKKQTGKKYPFVLDYFSKNSSINFSILGDFTYFNEKSIFIIDDCIVEDFLKIAKNKNTLIGNYFQFLRKNIKKYKKYIVKNYPSANLMDILYKWTFV